MPKYNVTNDTHIITIPMSDYQFEMYESARIQERKLEKSSKRKSAPAKGGTNIYKEATSTYRIFSRLFCNFAMPSPPGRPFPNDVKNIEESEKEKSEGEKTEGDESEGEKSEKKNPPKKEKGKKLKEKPSDMVNLLKKFDKIDKRIDFDDENEGELEADENLRRMGDATYDSRIKSAMEYLVSHSEE